MTNRKGLMAVLLLSVLLIGALLYPTASAAETPASNPPRVLSVTGQGRMEVKPDTATITLGVTQLRPTPMEAYEAMSADLAKVAGQVKSAGVKEDQIKTSTFNLQAEYNWTQEKGQVLSGYRATNSISITTQELEKVAALIQSAMSAGANQLQGVSFYVKDTEKLTKEALDLAVDDAKGKAEQVANRLGTKVVRVQSVSIQDNGMPAYRPMMDANAGMAKAAAMEAAPVFSGTAPYSVSVSVTFELQ